MIAILRLDKSNRIVLSRDLRKVAGFAAGQKLKVSAVPGRIILEMADNPPGKIIRRGKLKVWTGAVPDTSLKEAVEQTRLSQRVVLDGRWQAYRQCGTKRISLAELERRLGRK